MTFILKGAPYPINKNPLGYLFTQEGIATLKSDIIQLLLTNPSERVMLPEYGTGLRKLLFKPNDSFVSQEAENLIKKAITNWEPRIVVSQIEITNGYNSNTPNSNIASELNENDHVLKILIKFYDPANINYVEVLELELPTGG
jgi:phage baseplate assembly protein W